MDNTKESPTILSLCTGYGGLEKGIQGVLGEISVVAHVEIEAFAIANLVNKMEKGKMDPVPIYTDVKSFPFQYYRGAIDILAGGYPCQPFSAAGQRKGEEDPRHLWPWIRKAIRTIRPRICFFENVEGHISLGLRNVLTDLANLGYRVENDRQEPTWGIFSAEEVGAPHLRKRVFIMAYLPGQRCGKTRGHRSEESKERSAGGGKELADSVSKRREQKSRAEQSAAIPYNHGQKWPSRPGERQYEWPTPIHGCGPNSHGQISGQYRECMKAKGVPLKKLNPNWVEQLMGLEIGWTALDYSGME